MKKLITPLLLFAAINAFAQSTFEDVLNEVTDTYSFEAYTAQNGEVWKKSDGYYFVLYDRAFRYTDTLHVWTATKGVSDLDLPGADDIQANQRFKQSLLEKNRWGYYDFSPAYGYPGWSDDVIAAFSSQEELNPDERFMLGRAYSEKATNLLGDRLGSATKEEQVLADERNLDKAELKLYRSFRHEAVRQFELLAKEAPKYPTVVGPIEIKAANERVTAYLDLMMCSTEQEAKKELDGLSYPVSVEEYASHILKSCPANSVLFTMGDLDTYSTLYLQEVKAIRRDVRVVNIALLNWPTYIDLIQSAKPYGPALQGSLKSSLLSQKSFDYVRLNESDNLLSLNKAMSKLSNMDSVQSGFGEPTITLPSNKFSFTTDSDTFIIVSQRPFFLRNELVFYDHLVQDSLVHPICFSVTTGPNQFYLNRYTSEIGMVNLLQTKNSQFTVDISSFYWTPITTNDTYEESIIANQRITLIRQAQDALAVGRTGEAIEWIEFSLKTYPPDVHPLDMSLLKMVEILTKIAPEMGHDLFVQFAANFDSFKDYTRFGYYEEGRILRLTPQVDAFRDYFDQFQWED